MIECESLARLFDISRRRRIRTVINLRIKKYRKSPVKITQIERTFLK